MLGQGWGVGWWITLGRYCWWSSFHIHILTAGLHSKTPKLAFIAYLKFRLHEQWIIDLTKCQGTREIGLLYRGFIMSRFCSVHFKRPRWRIQFVILRTSLNRGSLKSRFHCVLLECLFTGICNFVPRLLLSLCCHLRLDPRLLLPAHPKKCGEVQAAEIQG